MLKMSGKERLEWYLQRENVPFRQTTHATAYTAQGLAQIEHLPGRLVAKVVVAKGNHGACLLVLPATRKVDLQRAAKAIGMSHLELAKEEEIAALFPDCEVGAMPPFGNLYQLPVYVDQSLAGDPEITFPAGSHRVTLTVTYADFARLVRPVVARFAHDA